MHGDLPALNYGVIGKRVQWQDSLERYWDGSWAHTATAIGEGHREHELFPALAEDLQCWLFTRPDM